MGDKARSALRWTWAAVIMSAMANVMKMSLGAEHWTGRASAIVFAVIGFIAAWKTAAAGFWRPPDSSE